jgi:UDP-N-acetylmuramoylalanine--D-glutamate ligase
MVDKDYFKGKKILVVGLGRSGRASSSLLLNLGAKVFITEKDINEKLKEIALQFKSKGVEVELGRHTKDFLKGKDLVVLSPGVDDRNLIVEEAERMGIPIISEIELAFMVCPAKIIAVSGTNGKTTVTSLIGRCLEEANKTVYVCGNIGIPFSSLVLQMKKDDFVSLEVSSFQLERIVNFKPYISVLLNFSPDHLDRYRNLEEYLEAKKRLFLNQDSQDFAVLNYDDPYIREIAKIVKAKVVFFRNNDRINQNFSAVEKVAQILGIDKEKIDNVFSNFKGIEHRLEYIGEFKGRIFINDSKATNVESTIWALDNLNPPIILIAGGRNKGLNFEKIKGKILEKVKLMVLIGESKEILRKEFKDIVKIKEADSLKEAVEIAFNQSHPKDTILLSPMCASFDMFANYEERGNVFKQIVKDLTSQNA